MSGPPSGIAEQVRFEAIGTGWTIDTPVPLGDRLMVAVHRRIDDFDAIWSRFRTDSVVGRLGATGGSFDFGTDGGELFALYDRLFALTGGAVSPVVGDALTALGYGAGYRLRPTGVVPQVPHWTSVATRRGGRISLRDPVTIDIGAAGKGYLIDLVAEVLRENGVDEYCIDAGGDLLHRGSDAVRVALEHPDDPRRAIGVVSLQNAALCGSAPNRRVWGDGLHHVLDARSGLPTAGVRATWAMASSALVADGIATALFFVDGPSLAAAFGPTVHYVRIAGGTVASDVDLPGEIFR